MSLPLSKTFQDYWDALTLENCQELLKQWIQSLSEETFADLLSDSLIESFDLEFLKKNKLVPLACKQNYLYMLHPEPSIELATSLSQTLAFPVVLLSVPQALIDKIWQPVAINFSTNALACPVTLSKSNDDSQSISSIFKELLGRAQELRASDIHLESQSDRSVLVRFRIDGLLHNIETYSARDFDFSTRLVSKIKVAADLDIAETRIPQDGRFTEQILDQSVDLRVSTLPALNGEKVVIRLLPNENPFQALRELGMEGESLLTYYNWIKKPQGMVLITGQTGSGKTSTLYTTLSNILHSEKNIVTIEDPIEYQLKGITQVQVHSKVGLTFANGLRSILRQDPDTILIGEIRDAETAEIAYQAALTGHMVLSTLHTNDAPSAIIRLMDIQVEPYLIASATLGVVAQRLIRRVCTHCAQPYTPGKELLLSLMLDIRIEYQFYRAVGCEICFQTGYYGREGIFEIMPVDEELANLISQKESLNRIKNHLKDQKVRSLADSAIAKAIRGLTTIEEINRVVPFSQLPTRPNARLLTF